MNVFLSIDMCVDRHQVVCCSIAFNGWQHYNRTPEHHKTHMSMARPPASVTSLPLEAEQHKPYSLKESPGKAFRMVSLTSHIDSDSLPRAIWDNARTSPDIYCVD